MSSVRRRAVWPELYLRHLRFTSTTWKRRVTILLVTGIFFGLFPWRDVLFIFPDSAIVLRRRWALILLLVCFIVAILAILVAAGLGWLVAVLFTEPMNRRIRGHLDAGEWLPGAAQPAVDWPT